YIVGIIAFYQFYKSKTRSLLISWFFIGIFVVIPNIFGAFKQMGLWNSFTLPNIWILLIVWPWLINLPNTLEKSPWMQKNKIAKHSLLITAFTLILCFAVILPFRPIKIPPKDLHYQYCAKIEQAIKTDLEQGSNILLPHGIMHLIRNNYIGVPLDRANSIIELKSANQTDQTLTLSRIKNKQYDRIYMNIVPEQWLGDKITQAIEDNYKITDFIEGPPIIGIGRGFQEDLMLGCYILRPK
ncbi:MAG: hypothetical protein KKA19_08950, partial [Candidatus Margulisbacteria bacterium]|nr:hypothetical protein [Candidatus Margulisiibacteriota bacterium]